MEANWLSSIGESCRSIRTKCNIQLPSLSKKTDNCCWLCWNDSACVPLFNLLDFALVELFIHGFEKHVVCTISDQLDVIVPFFSFFKLKWDLLVKNLIQSEIYQARFFTQIIWFNWHHGWPFEINRNMVSSVALERCYMTTVMFGFLPDVTRYFDFSSMVDSETSLRQLLFWLCFNYFDNLQISKCIIWHYSYLTCLERIDTVVFQSLLNLCRPVTFSASEGRGLLIC